MVPEIWCATDGLTDRQTDGQTEQVTYRGGCPSQKLQKTIDIAFTTHLELNLLIDYDWVSAIYMNISSSITLQTLGTH